MVNKLDSIHTQLAIQVLPEQAIKNYLCRTTTTTIFFLKSKMTLVKIICWEGNVLKSTGDPIGYFMGEENV